MDMAVETTESGVACITLSGSLDLAGAEKIDLQMSVVAGKNDKVMVDLADVPFMASVGIRTLVKAAKAIGNRGGKMVVARPVDAVQKVLETTGVSAMIPIHADVDTAVAELNAA